MNDIDAREQQLDEVIAGYLRAVKKGQAPTRQALLDLHPDLQFELASFLDDHAALNRLTTPLRAVFAVPPAPAQGQVIGGYELLEEIAHGGMGVVYKARQISLNRIVALKMMKAGPRAEPGELQRFRTEAEAVANLDHPHIVPIYEVGGHDGQPFYTMKLVDGGSLAKHLTPLRGDAPATARLLETVAQAVHYAHQRGILHRDLKPANILLEGAGPTARPLITDFGLAKRIDVESSLTQSGAIIGTPSYMAPEQASSRKGAVTTAADVYGLGAILYEILTGRPPFRAATLLDTLQLLLERDPEPPHTLNPAVDRDLETICLKCLEKDPARRYASAQALADDLHRCAAGEPIQARPVRSTERAWRWCRRKPVAAALVGTLLILFGGGLPLVTILWARSEHHAQQAETNLGIALAQEKEAKEQAREVLKQKRKVDEALKESRESFRLAHDAVNTFYLKVEQSLIHIPGLQGLRKELNQAALAYYQEFLKQRADDPTLQAELADVQNRVAHIVRDTGSKAEALAAYRQVLAIREKLLAADPSNLERQKAVALTHKEISNQLEALGQWKEAQAELEQTHTILEKLAAAHPNDLSIKDALAGSFNNLGALASRRGKNDLALERFQRAVALQKELVDSAPLRKQYQRDLALFYGNLGNIYGDRNQLQDSRRSYEQAHELRQRLYREDKNSPHIQLELAASYRGLGSWQRQHGDVAKAVTQLEESRKLLEQIVEANPQFTAALIDLAKTLKELAFAQRQQQQPDPALAALGRARDLLEKVAPLYGATAPLQHDLAMIYFELGIGHGQKTQRDAAVQAYVKGADILAKLTEAHPDNLDYHYKRALCLHNLASQYGPQGVYDKALAALEAALVHSRRAHGAAPKVAAYRNLLSAHYTVHADYLRKVGKLSEAGAAMELRLALWPQDSGQLYRCARDLALTAAAVGMGKADLSPEEERQRQQFADQAMNALRSAAAAGYANADELKKDKALDLLRGRDDFKKLLEDLATKK